MWHKRVARFLIVGGFNTVLDFTMLNIMFVLLKFPLLVANTISVTIGISISYFLNHIVVFQEIKKPTLKGYAHFFLITGFSVLCIQNVIITLITHVYLAHSIRHVTIIGTLTLSTAIVINFAKAIAVIVGMVWNFLLYKHVVFRRKNTSEDWVADLQ